jgi:hypothetical protein
MVSSSIQARLRQAPPLVLALVAGGAAFCTYSCMYAFRKPYTAAEYLGQPDQLGVTFKSILVIAQVIGYALSKFLGIKFVSESLSRNRERLIVALIGLAELALLGFALAPVPAKFLFLFLNGLPLGMVWGLVFSYLEGRQLTEIMGLVLCASFIFASALVKDVGVLLMGWGVPEFWMPFCTGVVFVPPLLLFVWLLGQVPPPTAEDQRLRTRRIPMDRVQRQEFFARFAGGLVSLVVVYTALTAYRDFRDSFQADILVDLLGADHEVPFSSIEIWVMLGVLAMLMLLVLVRDNYTALVVNHAVIAGGFALAGISTWLYQTGWISAVVWVGVTGFSAYVAYIPFNCILFERLIATFRYAGNVGFLIYVADAFGYLGSVVVLLYKDFGQPDLSWAGFYVQASYLLAALGVTGTSGSAAYFAWKHRGQQSRAAVSALEGVQG